MLEKTRRARGIAILTRLLSYAEKVLNLPVALSGISDARQRPQIKIEVIARAVLMMFLCRLGSLNSMEQLKDSQHVLKLLRGPMPSADSVGRIFDLVDSETIRNAIQQIYSSLKRNKALHAPWHGLVALIVDGHESHASYRRHCDGCLERKKPHGDGSCIQYYHRNVTAQLVFKNFTFMLDAEQQLPGEGELTCASRLLDRVLKKYSRAFQVVVMDALYAKNFIFNKIVDHGKDAIAVLKDNRRTMYRAAQAIVTNLPPSSTFNRGDTTVDCWDVERLWVQINKPIRLVMTEEFHRTVRRQLTDEPEEPPVSTWFWVTTLSPQAASTRAVVEIAHSRWSIENEGFNELSNHWHADHVYKHASGAILNFWLMSMLACNIFRAFFQRNLKSVARAGKSMLHFARMIASELYAGASPAGVPP